MTHLLDEQRLAVTAAAREIFRVSPETAWRWALRGVGGVKLESLKIGGKRYTSREACARFLSQINDQDAPRPVVLPISRADAAAQKLDRAGI